MKGKGIEFKNYFAKLRHFKIIHIKSIEKVSLHQQY